MAKSLGTSRVPPGHSSRAYHSSSYSVTERLLQASALMAAFTDTRKQRTTSQKGSSMRDEHSYGRGARNIHTMSTTHRQLSFLDDIYRRLCSLYKGFSGALSTQASQNTTDKTLLGDN